MQIAEQNNNPRNPHPKRTTAPALIAMARLKGNIMRCRNFVVLLSHFSIFQMAVATSACNSRPTYNIELCQFNSNCAGQTSALVQYDPDPFVRRIDAEPGHEPTIAAAGLTFHVLEYDVQAEFPSGIVCTFTGGSQTGDCRITATNEKAQCSSSLETICYRYPSQGRGFLDPIAQPGECVMPPSETGTPLKG